MLLLTGSTGSEDQYALNVTDKKHLSNCLVKFVFKGPPLSSRSFSRVHVQ